MIIHGIQKLTLLDYPEHLAAVLFTGSCNFRCPFCHNASLVLAPHQAPVIPEEEVLETLKKRRGRLTGVCITGGEPTLHADLPDLIARIKDLGYLIKLDTNGTNPAMIRQLYQNGLIDYVAMDIKASRANYPLVSGCPSISLDVLQESIDYLRSCGITHEFRTTAVKGLHTEEDFTDIAAWMAGCERYFLQTFKDSGNILDREQKRLSSPDLPGEPDSSLSGFSEEEMHYFLTLIQTGIPNARLRGVE